MLIEDEARRLHFRNLIVNRLTEFDGDGGLLLFASGRCTYLDALYKRKKAPREGLLLTGRNAQARITSRRAMLTGRIADLPDRPAT